MCAMATGKRSWTYRGAGSTNGTGLLSDRTRGQGPGLEEELSIHGFVLAVGCGTVKNFAAGT